MCVQGERVFLPLDGQSLFKLLLDPYPIIDFLDKEKKRHFFLKNKEKKKRKERRRGGGRSPSLFHFFFFFFSYQMEVVEEESKRYHTLSGRRVIKIDFTPHNVDDMERERFERDRNETRRIREEKGLSVGTVGRYPNEAYRRDIEVPKLSERIYRENRHTFVPPARSRISYRDIPYEIRNEISNMLSVRDLAKVSHLSQEWNMLGDQELTRKLGEIVLYTMKEDVVRRPFLIGPTMDPIITKLERILENALVMLEIKGIYFDKDHSYIEVRKRGNRQESALMEYTNHTTTPRYRGDKSVVSFTKIMMMDPSTIDPDFIGVYYLVERIIKVVIELTDLKILFIDRNKNVMKRF